MSYNIKLEIFEGPFDLLLYLIEKSRVDIYDIPVLTITDQYIEYINLMKKFDINIAADFLLMASSLIELKSKNLLPRMREKFVLPSELEDQIHEEYDYYDDDYGDDDYAIESKEELQSKLIRYKKLKDVAGELKGMETEQKKIFFRTPKVKMKLKKKHIDLEKIDFEKLVKTYHKIYQSYSDVMIKKMDSEKDRIKNKIKELIKVAKAEKEITFNTLLKNNFSVFEAIILFLSILELVKLNKFSIEQDNEFGEIKIIHKG